MNSLCVFVAALCVAMAAGQFAAKLENDKAVFTNPVGIGVTSNLNGQLHINPNGDEAMVIGTSSLTGTRPASIVFTDPSASSSDNSIQWLDGSGATAATVYTDASGKMVIDANGDVVIRASALDLEGAEIKNFGNLWWGKVAVGFSGNSVGGWATSTGTSGTDLYVPDTDGGVVCSANNEVCLYRVSSTQIRASFEVEAKYATDWFVGQNIGGLCWGVAGGDNETDRLAFGAGVVSVSTDQNGHCIAPAGTIAYGTQLACVSVDIEDDHLVSHDIYGVMCYNPNPK